MPIAVMGNFVHNHSANIVFLARWEIVMMVINVHVMKTVAENVLMGMKQKFPFRFFLFLTFFSLFQVQARDSDFW